MYSGPSSARVPLLIFLAAALLLIFGALHQTGAVPESVKTAWVTKFARQPSFLEIATKHGTDKVTDHQYQYMYEKHLSPIRNQKKLKMLEIGLGCNMNYGPGASYYTWLEYFPHVDLYYLEYDAACAQKWGAKTSGATIYTGDQADPDVLSEVISKSGGEFDIIVDDGGHTMKQQQTSLEHLWKAVKPGGIYFVEDLQTSFWTQYGGDPTGGKDPKIPTMLKFIYEMIDDRMAPDGDKHLELTADLRGVECQREVCAFFKKGGEDEPGSV
ncbi:uncharacterized protein B0I36DRAFT_146617 [Microdochium trichocladiopsis]|uniref:Hard-surface induced protein 5 n=1 Tax=Microdochium trichocladiopsis TaxID=1682393 RepID=A0A9P8Y394_9PEZI|nr:uncharacterized protein B0I36DRAFT_146617 [Microdochium trichocladiopsis]KAH7028054.1 hypothetical protein B0I36DRAFT_146617 [Microdochium trichocladiopsis]